jgi:hypothetical protein
MDPAQMEGFLVNYYEYHFLYITGIEHVESKSIQGVGLIKLQFHPGTDMAGAMAETVVRTLWAPAQADQGATVWGGLGPQVQAARTFLTPPPASAMVDTMYRQQKYVATGGFNWSATTFGRIKSAIANVKIAELDLDRELD